MAGCADSREAGADDENVEMRTLSVERQGIIMNARPQGSIAHAASPLGSDFPR
jgi:hypothetical protein